MEHGIWICIDIWLSVYCRDLTFSVSWQRLFCPDETTCDRQIGKFYLRKPLVNLLTLLLSLTCSK